MVAAALPCIFGDKWQLAMMGPGGAQQHQFTVMDSCNECQKSEFSVDMMMARIRMGSTSMLLNDGGWWGANTNSQ
jgi:hypothetical protein